MLMADAAYPISNAAESSFGDDCNRLMCHIHVNRNIKKKAGGIRSEAVKEAYDSYMSDFELVKFKAVDEESASVCFGSDDDFAPFFILSRTFFSHLSLYVFALFFVMFLHFFCDVFALFNEKSKKSNKKINEIVRKRIKKVRFRHFGVCFGHFSCV